MSVALEGIPEESDLQPEGVTTVRIDRKTGKLATPGADGSYFEFFREEYIPTEYAEPFANVQPVVAEPVVNNTQNTQQPVTREVVVNQPVPVVKPRKKPNAQKKQVDSLF